MMVKQDLPYSKLKHSKAERFGSISLEAPIEVVDRKEGAFQFLRKISPFDQLPQGSIEDFADCCRPAVIDAGSYMMLEGGPEPKGFIVASGRLAVLKNSRSGRELVVELLSAGDIFGLLVALERLPAQLSIRAQARSDVPWIPAPALASLLATHTEIYNYFLIHLLRCLQSSYSLARGLAHDRVDVRIAAVLSSLSIKYPRIPQSEHECVIDITRQQIAELTGTTSETAIRVTRALHKKKLIDTSHPGMIRILDSEGLLDIVEQ